MTKGSMSAPNTEENEQTAGSSGQDRDSGNRWEDFTEVASEMFDEVARDAKKAFNAFKNSPMSKQVNKFVVSTLLVTGLGGTLSGIGHYNRTTQAAGDGSPEPWGAKNIAIQAGAVVNNLEKDPEQALKDALRGTGVVYYNIEEAVAPVTDQFSAGYQSARSREKPSQQGR